MSSIPPVRSRTVSGIPAPGTWAGGNMARIAVLEMSAMTDLRRRTRETTNMRGIRNSGGACQRSPVWHAHGVRQQRCVINRLIVAVVPVHSIVPIISVNRHARFIVFLSRCLIRIISGSDLKSGVRQGIPIHPARGECQCCYRCKERRIKSCFHVSCAVLCQPA